MNIAWALRRLSAMSSREIGYRVARQLRASAEQLGFLTPVCPAPNAQARGWTTEFADDFDAARYVRAADDVLSGRFRVFALRPAQLGFPPEWNRDPKTGVRAPLRFGKALNYRDEQLVGDIKYLWEPSRHAELVTLAQAWRLTGAQRYADGCRVLLESWIDQCPYPLGVHWSSSLEHAVRLIHWSFAWRLLGGYEGPLFRGAQGEQFRRRWLDAVYLHCCFIANHFSRFSSANNHLFGELTGLFVACVTWPYWRESERWRKQAQTELEREMLLQNAADGVNREQATWYHHEMADMALLAGLAARADGRDFSDAYWMRWKAMLDYIAAIMDLSGRVPQLGDSDDAIIARLDPSPDFDPFRALLAAGAVLFEDSQLKFKARALDDKTRWLLGPEAAPRFAALEARSEGLPRRRRFEEGGCYVLGRSFETPQEVRIVADAGPLGYLSIAAHGHADALSFVLSAGGRELLIDPGTYAYHTQRRWRDYFRGASAHNTLRIDGEDQSLSGGAFLWRTHAQTKVLECVCDGNEQRLVAEHDGYRRLKDPVRHRRTLEFNAARAQLTVIDELYCEGKHHVEQFWHFAEACDVERCAGALVAVNDNARLMMQPDPNMQLELQRGQETPPLGWISRAFDVRTPTHSACASMMISGYTRIATSMRVELAAQPLGVVTPTRPRCTQAGETRLEA